MAIRLTDFDGEQVDLDELLDTLSYNLKSHIRDFVFAQDKLYIELHDAEYNDFGSPREYSNPYPLSLAEAREKCRVALDDLHDFYGDASRFATFPSLALAEAFARDCRERMPAKSVSVRTEKRGELTYLLVSCDEEISVIDIDSEITEASRRNTFEDEKVIDGISYPLRSFLPESYRKSHTLYQTKLRHLTEID